MSQNIPLGSKSFSDTANDRSQLTVGSEIKGDLRSPGTIELQGHVEGKVSADAVIIEESGSVIGELHAANVAIKGQFEGKIFGGDVKLHALAKISGEIHYQTLSIESGAQVNSTCTVKKQA